MWRPRFWTLNSGDGWNPQKREQCIVLMWSLDEGATCDNGYVFCDYDYVYTAALRLRQRRRFDRFAAHSTFIRFYRARTVHTCNCCP